MGKMSFYKLVTIGVIFFLFVVGFLGVYLNNTFLKFGIPIEFIFIGISIIWMYVKMVDSKNKILGVCTSPLSSDTNLVSYIVRRRQFLSKLHRRHFQCRVYSSVVVLPDGLVDFVD